MTALLMPRIGLRLSAPTTLAAVPKPWCILANPTASLARSLSTTPSRCKTPLHCVSSASRAAWYTQALHSSRKVPHSDSTILRSLPHLSHRFQSTLAPNVDSATPSTSTTAAKSTPVFSRPIVAAHLYALAFLVYAIVVVGGLTRLTESGLSITEWNPGFKGMRLPMTTEEWTSEWDKYKQTPEFLLLNSKMSLDDFKSIYMWEWGHRVLGRVIGVAFVLPAAFFLTRRWVGVGTRWKLVAIAAGIGFQGFLGWFMVKSGLTAPEPSGKAKTVSVPVPVIKDDHPNSTANTQDGKMRYDASVTSANVPTSSAQTLIAAADWTPRVSHFRLALHMGAAFLVYLAMLHTGLAVQRDYNSAKQKGKVSGVSIKSLPTLQRLANTLSHRLIRSHSRLTKVVTALVFTTAMSGALVAGLDAGLLYNEFPTMGEGRIAPPMDELMDDRFAQKEDGSDKIWRNLSQNPVTVQLIHRTLAVTTACTVVALAWKTRKLSKLYSTQAQAASNSAAGGAAVRSVPTAPLSASTASVAAAAANGGAELLPTLPPRILQLAYASCGVVAMQVTLGITTLIYMVPIPLASAHQAGALALLSILTAMISSMRPISARLLKHLSSQHSQMLRKVLKPTQPSAATQ